jgi:hypothetical protein
MTRIFRREGAGFPDLRSFFLAWREINPEKLAQLARRFLELARTADPDTDILEEMAELFSDRSSRRARFFRESVSSFLEEMAGGMGELLRSDLLPTDTLEQWATAAREAASQVEALNMPPAAVVEALFYRLRAEAAP